MSNPKTRVESPFAKTMTEEEIRRSPSVVGNCNIHLPNGRVCGEYARHGIPPDKRCSCVVDKRDGFEVFDVDADKVVHFVECTSGGHTRDLVERGLLRRTMGTRFLVRDTRAAQPVEQKES